jgi:hypothetical protein
MFHADTNTFSSEMSMLEASGGRPLSRYYDDACDAGFLLVSHKTSVAAGYTLDTEHRNRDNDITHWTFKPTAEAVRKNPQLAGTSVVIWNT